MSYPSVDALQKTLSEQVFSYTADAKKASGRALGTLVEIISFYTMRGWGFRDSIAIERPLPEYGNPDITHNVEFSLHPVRSLSKHTVDVPKLPLSSSKIRKAVLHDGRQAVDGDKSSQLVSSDLVLRNSCLISEDEYGLHVVNLDTYDGRSTAELSHSILHPYPYAIFECKRVGVEEGQKKGPQTIEKAKQGAYVARTASSLQKVRLKDGTMGGLIHASDGTLICKEYEELIKDIINSTDKSLLQNFVMTVGVVSNHGNWFTAENQNKELKVLAQSYDWLLFLTDAGLASFINEFLLSPTPELLPAREAFLASYTGNSGKNRFTKTRMDLKADEVLVRFFAENADRIEGWFNIITPRGQTLHGLREELSLLRAKNWEAIHQ
jgi:hypothetical protein